MYLGYNYHFLLYLLTSWISVSQPCLTGDPVIRTKTCMVQFRCLSCDCLIFQSYFDIKLYQIYLSNLIQGPCMFTGSNNPMWRDKTAVIITSSNCPPFAGKSCVLKAIFHFCICTICHYALMAFYFCSGKMITRGTNPPLDLPLCPPIIVINGSYQGDKPGWPILSRLSEL